MTDSDTVSDFSQDRAFLVTLQPSNVTSDKASANLEELCGLVSALGMQVVGKSVVKQRESHPQFLIGSGKAKEIADEAKECEAGIVVFDDDLSPSQQRNWEEMSELTVIDRQEVILEIFSQRAMTREAVLQVGLARMEYSLPRLARSYTHLSRQGGGSRNSRGGGEMQLEVDRRVILKKIDKLKEELESVRAHRQRTRAKRQETPLPTASIVGYTNAGKSTLLNALAETDVLAQDKLFATLDPTTRKANLGAGTEILITDTVGFVQKLPHHLIDAFRSTLEEAIFADFLIHVVDVSHPQWASQMDTTRRVLASLSETPLPEILVFNKVDAVGDNQVVLRSLELQFPDAHFVSVREGSGMPTLREGILKKIAELHKTQTFHFPLDRGDLVGYLYKNGQVLVEEYRDEHIYVQARVAEQALGPVKEFQTP